MTYRYCKTFKPFSWISEDVGHSPANRLAVLSHDVAAGVALVAEILEDCHLDSTDGEQERFSPSDQGKLLRLARASAEMLQAEAFDYLEWLNEHGPKKPVSQTATAEAA